MRAQVVVGGMYGDEGKGLMTDALAARMLFDEGHCIVARCNGGAQAGHTVQLPDGRRHVFHHLGSGALAGAPTYLGRRFVAHPMLFLQERDTVLAMGGNVRVWIDARALITTPYDVLLNQAVERSRGQERHGSCGVGFGETIERNQDERLRMLAGDLSNEAMVRETLERIRRDYLPKRLHALGLPADALDAWRMQEGILERFVEDARDFSDMVGLRTPRQALGGGFVVFEGAQGLALDEDLGDFPHVTRSHTGLPYVVEACREAGIGRLDVHYGTRAYTTRHGAGPMRHETGLPPPRFADPTNQPNPFQGALRFSPLQLDYLARLVAQDMARVDKAGMDLRMGAWVSCMDQVDARVPIAGEENVVRTDLARQIGLRLGAQWVSTSQGPTRGDVQLTNVDPVACEGPPAPWTGTGVPLPLPGASALSD